jgi:4-amino-4-deoxy-L-arabinose transferase-like glycosyltransferase
MLRIPKSFRLSSYLILIIVLLLVFASRVQFLTDTPLSIDEARSGLRMMGTPAEIIAWQPPDWPPLHNLMLGAWSSIAGEFPFSLRVFSAFFSLISVCIAYRMAYQLTKDHQVAWGTLIFYAGLGMSIYLVQLC